MPPDRTVYVWMLGSHCLRTYSVTQAGVTLSSAEAELLAVVRASSEAIGLCQLAASWGLSLTGEVFGDSSAALAIVKRRGCGKLRHVRVGHLWVQEAAASGTLRYSKVQGTSGGAQSAAIVLVNRSAPRLRGGREAPTLALGLQFGQKED